MSTEMNRLRSIADVQVQERRAVLEPGLMASCAKVEDDQLRRCSKELFGWDYPAAAKSEGFAKTPHVSRLTPAWFAERGWDVLDEHGLPLRSLDAFAVQLAMAILGLGGSLPRATPEAWGVALEAEARNFRRRAS